MHAIDANRPGVANRLAMIRQGEERAKLTNAHFWLSERRVRRWGASDVLTLSAFRATGYKKII